MYKRHTLNNGLKIITENIPYVKSITIGVWIKTGSKYESLNNNGVAHFIEHMIFKGTTSKSAKEIADLVDGVGGQINAFTSKEYTCYYIKVLDSHLDLAIDLLSDMLFNSVFDEQEINKERSVIFEEINMYEDSPEDLVHELLATTLFKNNTLGFPILGIEDSLNKIDRKVMIEYTKLNYVSNNSVLSVAGNFDENKLLEAIESKFGQWKPNENIKDPSDLITYHNEHVYKQKDIEQTHICIGFPSVSLKSKNLYSIFILNNILGGSMSSRLFQKVREEHGLVYSIYSYPSSYTDAGLLVIYAGMNPGNFEEVCSLIFQELNEIKINGISESDLAKTKEQLKGNYILGLESTSSRMTSIGRSELLLGKINSPKEVIALIDQVTLADMRDTINAVIDFSKISSAMISKENQINKLKKYIP